MEARRIKLRTDIAQKEGLVSPMVESRRCDGGIPYPQGPCLGHNTFRALKDGKFIPYASLAAVVPIVEGGGGVIDIERNGGQ
jgi:hypothetical protein